MAVIYVPGAISGTQYAVNIAGDVPTPEEQARIDQHVAQQEAAFQSRYESMFGPSGEEDAAQAEDTTAFGRSIDVGLAGLRRAYGSTLEGIGTVTGLEGLAGYGAGVAEREALELERLAEAAALEKEREAQGAIGSAATYVGEIAGASAPQTAIALAGGYAGAKAGAAIGAFGGPVGAAVGGFFGGLGGAALASLPYFYGDFREQQKEADIEAGRPVEVSEGAAALAAIPASVLDGVLSAVGAKYGANVLKKAAEGGIFTRAARGAAGGALTEVPTEIGQELLGIIQAGKDPFSDEAIQRYGEAALGAAVLGGGIGAVGGAVITGRKAEEERKKRELDEDIKALGARGDQYIQNARENRATEVAERVASPEVAPLALPAPSTARTTPQEETALRGRAGMEAITPTRPVALTSLPMEERVAISRARTDAGREASPEVTLEELQAVAGTAASEREAKKQKPVTGGIARFGPVENKTFTQEQYDRAVQQVKADKGVSFPKIQKAVRDITKKAVPNTVVRDIRDEMVSRGVIRADTKSRTGYSIEPIARTDSIETSLRREIDGLNKQIDLSQKDRTSLVEEVRRVEQTGKDSSGKRADPALFNQKLDTLDASIEAAKARVAAAETEIRNAKQAGAIPSVERVAMDAAKVAVPMTGATAPAIEQQMDTLRQNIAGYDQQIKDAEKQAINLRKQQKKVQLNNAQKSRLQQLDQTVADLRKLRATATARLRDPSATVQAANEREAASQARFNAATMKEPVNYTPIFTAQQQKVFGALRKRLNNLGLKDVRLEGAQAMLARDQSGKVMGVAEGKYDPVKRIISLSMGIYRKGITDQQLFDSIASVMNHEVIHALRLMGVLTDAEWRTLTTYAKNKKYVEIKQGKPVERSYTYEERARAMGYDESVVQEEAVAELFRDYLDGKTTVKGPQKTIFERLKSFFKSLIGVHAEQGFDSVEKIFEGIRYGEIGARPRGAATTEAARESAIPSQSVIVQRAKDAPMFSDWFGDSKAVDDAGEPRVYYTGTSKDKDFTSFNVSRHGGWFTANPSEASEYAMQNDSMGYRIEGWNVVETNVASRVIPAFLRITNPYRGPLPENVIGDNYKKLQSDWFDTLRARGYDGWMPQDAPSIAVVLQEPQQVKSAFASDFDPRKKDMRLSSIPLSDANVSVDDQLSPEELADMNRQLDDLAVAIAADPRERRSFMPVPSPVKNRDGTDSYSYGTIIDYRGRQQSVILPVGEHIFRERGVDTGYGLKHIIARKHDQELYEMSKYKDVNKAIFDMLQVWKQQGMRNGDSVIGGKDGDQFALEWIDNRPLKAPRLRLVLSENNRLTPDPFHYVHSFYPSETRVYERGPKPYRRFSAIPAKIMEEYDATAKQQEGRLLSVYNPESVRRVEEGKRTEDGRSRAREELAASAWRASFQPVTEQELRNIDGASDEDFRMFFKRPGWAVLTATQENIDARFKDDINNRNNQELRYLLERDGVPFAELSGVYKGEDQGVSFLVLMDEDKALRLGGRYGQESILTNSGLVYTRPLPTTPVTGEMLVDEEARAEDFFSEFVPRQDPERAKRNYRRAFSMGLDFSRGPGRAVIPEGYYEISSRPQLPIRKEDGKVELYHWSGNFLTVVDPSFRYKGPYRSQAPIGFRGSFYGINPRGSLRAQGTGYVKEGLLGSRLHMALVDPDRLYPFHLDPDNLKATVTGQTPEDHRQYYERAIIDAGYIGYYTEVPADAPGLSPLGNVAVVAAPLPVELVRNREFPTELLSRVPISDRLRSLSVIDRVGEDGNFRDVAPRNKKGERIANIKKEDAMRTLQADRGNFVFDLRDPKSVDQIATIMAAEAEVALGGDTSALGWYDRLVKLAKRVVATLHPEILTDKDAEHAFDYATAVTSNGLSVKDNYILANRQYENWRSTGYFIEGKEGTSGKQGASMEAAFGAYNMMKRPRDEGGLGMSDAQIIGFLSSRMTVGDLRRNRVVQSLGITVDAKEKATAVINGSYIMGPKIGQGFYQNLRGNFDQLTMDRWWMRFFNRLSGNPFKTYGDETIQSNINRLRGAMVNPSDVPMILQAMKDIDADILTDDVVGQLSIEIDKVFQRAYMKAPTGQKPKKNEIFLAADSLRPKIEGELEESPRNATDREFMRDVTRRAVDKLAAATGVRLDMADFQALMWYWEKRLWRSLGIRQGRGEDNDYVDGAIELLRRQGVPDGQIREALPDGERQRLSAEPDTGRDETEVPSGVGGRLEEEERIAAERAAYAAGVEGRRNKITGARESRVPLRNSITGKVQRQTAQKQTNVVYSKAADLLAKGLRIPGLGVDEARSKQIADGIIKKFQDGMIPVGRMIDELRANGLNITDAMDTYMQEELYHGVVGEKVEQAQTNLYRPLIDLVGTLKVTDQAKQQLIAASNSASVGRGFADVAFKDTRSNALSMADIFLYASHAKERNEYIRGIDPENDAGSGMTDREADAILAWFARSPYASTMQKIADAAQRIVQSTNDVRLEGGLIPKEFFQYTDPTTGDTVDVPQYDHYVPLRGKRDPSGEPIDDQATGPYRSPMYGARRREDRRSLGRYDYADNIIPNLLVQNQNAIIRAERNKVGQSFLQLLRSDPAKTKAYGRILTPGDMKDVQTRVLVERKRADGTVSKTVQTVLDPNFRQEPDIFVVKEDGKEVIVKLENDAIASALKGSMSPTHNNMLIRALATINRYLASINTSLNPAFFITNFFRDLQTAGVNVAQYEIDGLTRKVVGDVPGALRGIKQSIRNNDNSSQWARIYRDFVKNGGQNATNQVNTVADQMNNISGIIGDIADSGARKQFNRVKNGFVGKGAMSLLSFIEDYNTVIENGIRVATYKALLDKGLTPQRAAQAARNITVNFAKGGDYKVFMNSMYLFYNASLQGSFAMLNAALRSRRVQKLWAAAIGVGLMQDYLNAMLSGDDEDGEKLYDKIPEYVLEHNLILPDPFGFTERSYISIPMPYGLNMAHNLGRAMGRLSRGAYDASEAAGSIVGTMIDVVNPIGGTESFANAAAPTVLDPFIDIWQNENFANQPVYKQGFPGDRTPSSQLYWSTTSVPAVWLASTMNSVTGGTTEVKGLVDVSPDLVDFWFEYLTGGVGRFVIRTAETPFRAYDEGFSEEVIRNVPIFGKIIGTVTTREDTGEYIEKRDRVLTALDEIKAAVEEGNTERIAGARERFSDELKVSGAVRAIDNARTKLARQMRQVRESRLPEEQKRLILERLDERMQQLTARGNQLMRDL